MLNNSTLKLEAEKQSVNYTTAWSTGSPSKSSATVSVLKYEGTVYLVTNAHAVANAHFLKAKFNQGSHEIPVTAVWVDPVMDVAILKANTEEGASLILKKVEPLEVDTKFQASSTEVNAYGYPAGGKGLSFTKGHISRTEISQIAYSNLPGITVQTSAPINPGNSGGPITVQVKDKEVCVGIVTQGNTSLSNVGYFIPATTVVQVIENYKKFGKLKDAKCIDYVTVPQVSFQWQSLKNSALRHQVGMKPSTLDEELTGIYVTKVSKNSCAFNKLQDGDVILEIDGHPILANGHVEVAELGYPISFLYLIQRKKYMDKMEFLIQRKNSDSEHETLKIEIRLNEQLGRNILGIKDGKPLKYHIQPSGKNGGFVFVKCTQALMDTYKSNYATGQRTITDYSNMPPMFNDFTASTLDDEQYEIVVLHHIFASEDTDGYENFALSRGALCESHRVVEVNDKKINNLHDLVTLLAENEQNPSSIKFANGKKVVIAPQVLNTKKELQQRYQIAFFTSAEVARGIEEARAAKDEFINKLKAVYDENKESFLPSEFKM